MAGRGHCDGPVLVIEADDDLRNAMTEFLGMDGRLVFQASNGAEGIEILRMIERPCLVLLDVMMPVMDGHGFMELLLADEVLSSIPVVLVSAAHDSLPRGAKGFMRKPFELEELIRVVKEHCQSDAVIQG